MRNDINNPSDRNNAALLVSEIISEIKNLANTETNGHYIFSGTKTDTIPFVFDNDTTPSFAIYQGNTTEFSIKTGKKSSMPVGNDGNNVFNDNILTVDITNNKIDFIENRGGSDIILDATIPSTNYRAVDLAQAIGAAMSTASEAASPGAGIAYNVVYDANTQGFSIADDNTGTLTSLQLLWRSGNNNAQSIGADIGFSDTDNTGSGIGGASYQGSTGVVWGIFKTLIDFRDYLEASDVDGMERTMTRLDAHFEHILNKISSIGVKGVKIDIQTSIIEDLNLGYEKNKNNIENADFIKAISDLSAYETAYQATLTSSAKVMKLSLADYI
jgi:flagellar hook-associated protein 3 FlgL